MPVTSTHGHGGHGHAKREESKKRASSASSRSKGRTRDTDCSSISSSSTKLDLAITREEVTKPVQLETESTNQQILVNDGLSVPENMPGTEVENDNESSVTTEDMSSIRNENHPSEGMAKNIDIQSFNSEINNFNELFGSEKFTNIGDNYPIDELLSAVLHVSQTIDEYKRQTMESQRNLEHLGKTMTVIKENLHLSVQKKLIELDDEYHTVEERELVEKLAKINADLVKVNSELSETVQLVLETECTAVRAHIATEKAKNEAKRIEEELQLKSEFEAKQRAEEKRKMEEANRLREMGARRENEARLAKELEWKRHEEHGIEKQQAWEKWTPYEYPITNDNGETEIGCIIRGDPNNFTNSSMNIENVDQGTSGLTYGPQEELVSTIIKISAATEDAGHIKEPLFVAIPYVISRSAHASREAFVKTFHDGHWQEVVTKEVTFEKHKEYRFVQVELRELAPLAVMTRYKRDYITLTRKSSKIASTFDQRITISIQRDTFNNKEHVLLQVQPVDSGSVNDLRAKNHACKRLLTASPIVDTTWESATLSKPLTITIPCPPNPAKAKKLAHMRAMKEEKMKNPQKRIVMLPDEVEKEKERERKKQQQILDMEEHRHTRWYMGEYAHSDDDENDRLWLLSGSTSGRWSIVNDVSFEQVKLDLLQFNLDRPLERFVVLRTRPNLEEEAVAPMATALSDFLCKRFAQVIIRQRGDNPFETVVGIAPVNKVDGVQKRLTMEGFDCGPEASSIISLNEGDVIRIGFKGNIQNTDDECLQFTYNSNLKSEATFYSREVDRYLQKSYSVYRGVIQIYRNHRPAPDRSTGRQISTVKRTNSVEDGINLPEEEMKTEFLCEIPFDIPKYHLEKNTTPRRAPITILNSDDPVNDELIRHLSVEIGEEWRKVAGYLNVSRVRIQAILRNIQADEQTEECARYEMLMTWLKKMPKAADKVAALSSALNKSGRSDLAEDLRSIKQEYEQHSHEQRVG